MKVSHSSVKMYSECGRKYRYHYLNKIRSKTTSGALLMGNALDKALNVLLTTKDLDKAKQEFSSALLHLEINGVRTYMPTSHLIVYSKSDFDEDLLNQDDIGKFEMMKKELNYQDNAGVGYVIDELTKKKSMVGLNGLSIAEKTLLSLGNFLSIHRKGLIMLDSYNTKILPRIKNVLAIQKEITLQNGEGDVITGFIDLIAEWDDGKIYVLDNKTTSSMQYYPDDAPSKSQQLIIYKHAMQEEYDLSGVGFIVMEKGIKKNKAKSCLKCGFNGTGSRHKTCANEIEGKRCNGEWLEVLNPEAYIAVLINEVPTASEDLVLDTFDRAVEGIKSENFGPNLSACKQGGLICPYAKLCWEGNMDDLVDLGDKK